MINSSRSLERMIEGFNKGFHISELAKHCGLLESYIVLRLKELMKESPLSYPPSKIQRYEDELNKILNDRVETACKNYKKFLEKEYRRVNRVKRGDRSL